MSHREEPDLQGMKMPNMADTRLRVGVLGAGEVAQVIHLPTLALLSHLYTVTAICDISEKTAHHVATKFHIPTHTTSPSTVIASPQTDLILNLTSDAAHEPTTIAALRAGKSVLLEKPLTLSLPSAQRILAAERGAPNGARVFVGYMRRYARSFTQTFLREVGGIDRILYARVRDFSGPNGKFVAESGTFPVKGLGDVPVEVGAEGEERLGKLLGEAFEGREVTDERRRFARFLGSLGSHDISLMREVLGFPESVGGVSANEPFYSAIFNYRNRKGGKEPFSVTYESGIDGVPEFDAHFAVYGERKRVMIKYDSPYVKGLPIKVTVQEVNAEGEMETREVLGSYEDAYTAELKELYECLRNGKEIKTSAEDAMEDLRLYDLMYERWEKERV
ncbi:hypothetical protein WHR41_02107 [Cladosporium halotolerans]|uniref:Gfo/Idh/MocA-like oxidoreductase N-terminal domain-containing protein n=1 Tax=Cladosporium halotolerans TaxID=1052096 RepID=A0AB34KVI9_9PEZI